MTKLALGVVIALAVLTGEARASFMDGNGLYKACSSNSSAEQDICLGYIEGATDYLEWTRSDRNEKQCVPAQVVLQQIEDVVMVYLRDHPDYRTNLAAALVATAITQAWNCD